MNEPNSRSEDNPASLTDVEMHGNEHSSGSRPPTVELILQQLLENMERSDARMTTLLATTEEVHRSMTLRAEEAERQIKQFAEKLEGLERRRNLLPMEGQANEDVDMGPADQIGNREERRHDGNEADDETDPEDEEVQQLLVPLRITLPQFSGSVIGAGPPMRLRQVPNTTPTSAVEPNITTNMSSPHESGGVGQGASSTEQVLLKLVDRVDKLCDQVNQSRARKYGAPRSREFRLPPRRFTTPDRNARLSSVRSVMNRFLGIKKDVDVITGNYADENDIAAFENDESAPGPTAPYSPDWSNIKGPWNHALLILFMAEYVKEYAVEEEDDQDDICKMFMDRLARLRKKVRQGMRPGETQVQMTARYLARHRRLLLLQRRNTRRNERFDTRSRITVQNALAQTNEARLVWEHLDDILVALGAGGMSSDESEVEDGQRVFLVKKMTWRRSGLTAKICAIDRDRNATNTYGNVRAGNPPRIRKRRNGVVETSRGAPPELPVNFYDAEWLSKLTNRQRKELRPRAALELLEFDTTT